jgi:exodeoxyribonuclease III
MRLVTWNVHQALTSKWPDLLGLSPDVAVLPEVGCADLSRLAPESRWVGNLPSRGLGVAGFNGWTVDIRPEWNCDIEFVVPLQVRREDVDFTLLAVWAMDRRAVRVHPDRPARGQVRQAIELYASLLNGGRTVIAGDFNNAPRFDKGKREPNYALSVAELGAAGMVSAYHAWSGLPQGSELHKTHYLTYKKESPFHIDYVWLPEAWSVGLTVEVGGYERWIASRLSDHVPLMAEFSLNG